MPVTPKISVDDFASQIKQKYPAYKDVDNSILVKSILQKYPVYNDQVDTTGIGEKKNLGGSVSSNGGTVSQPTPLPSTPQSGLQGGKLNFDLTQEPQNTQPDLINNQPPTPENNFGMPSFSNLAKGQQSTSENTSNIAPIQAAQKVDFDVNHIAREKVKQARTDAAINNTVERGLKLQGISANPNSSIFNENKNKIKAALDLGLVRESADINGVPGLKLTTGFLDNFKKGWNEVSTDEDESKEFTHNMNYAQMVDYANRKQAEQKPSAFIGETPSLLGSVGKMGGEAGPMGAKMAIGAGIGAASIAATPESLGASLTGLPLAMSFFLTADAAANQSVKNLTLQNYQILKKQYPNRSDEENMKDAFEKSKYLGIISGLGTNAAMIGTSFNLPIINEGESVINKTINNIGSNAVHFGSIGAASTTFEQEGSKLEGIDRSQSDIFKNAAESFGGNFKTGMILSLGTHAPAILKSAFKYGMVKTAPIQDYNNAIDANVNMGNISFEQGQGMKQDLQGYADGLAKTGTGLSPESEMAVAGLNQKRDNLEKSMEGKDAGAKKSIKDKMDAIDAQVQKIYSTNKPYEHEVDGLTGQTYKPPTFDEVAKQQVEDLASKISKGQKITDPEDIQLQTSFHPQLVDELNKIQKQEEQRNKNSENPKTELTQNIDNYLNQHEKQQAAKIPKPEAKTSLSNESVGEVEQPTEEELIKRVNDNGKAKNLVQGDNIDELKSQSLTAPNSVNKILDDENLTTDLIASNPESEIKDNIKYWKSKLGDPNFSEADDHLALLETGLKKKQNSISNDTQNILDRVNNAEYINENDISNAENQLYGLLDKNPNAAHLIEPLIEKLQNYEFTTKTETRTVTEKVPTGRTTKTKTEIKPILEQGIDQPVTVTDTKGNKSKGVLRLEDGNYIVSDENGNKVSAIGEKAINDRDLTLPDESEVDNPISFDKDGNVKSVTVKTKNGSLISIENPEKALDIAIQLRAQEIGNIPDNVFDQVFDEVQKQVNVEVPKYPEKLGISATEPVKNEIKSNEEKQIKEDKQNTDKTSSTEKPIEEGKQPIQSGTTKTENKEPPPQPTNGNEPNGEESKSVSGVKKYITNKVRQSMELPKVEFPKDTPDIEGLLAAKNRIDKGEVNPIDLVNRILSEKTGYKHEDEVWDMQYYAHQLKLKDDNLRSQLSDAKDDIEKASIRGQLGQLSDEVDRQTEAAQLAGNKWHKIGEGMQTVIDDGFNPSRERNFIKDAYGGEIPKDVKIQIDKLTEERDNALNEKKKIEGILKDRMTNEALKKIKKDAEKTAKRDETKEKLKAEEQELLGQIKKALKKDLGNLNTGIPIPKETLNVLGKLAVNYFKQGALTVEALVDKMYEALKDDVEGIQKKDIKDFIASYEPLTIERETQRLTKKAEGIESKITPTTLKTKKGKLAGVSENPNFNSETKQQLIFRNNSDWVKANQRVANAEFRMRRLKQKAFESNKNFYQRSLMWAGRLTRISILSGTNVLYKLSAAAVIGGAGKRIPEQAIGAFYSKIFTGIANKAPIEGGINANAEANFYKEFFNPKKFAQNSWEILKTGESKLSQRLEKGGYDHVPVLYLPTDLHQIIKDPVKRGAFEASFRYGLKWAENNGLDINSPLVIQSLETAAYKRANYEIFQEDNSLSRKFRKWKSELERKGNTGATAKFLVDFMIPVSTVPTNIVRRLATTSPFGLMRGSKMVLDAYREGIGKLSNDQADRVMKQLKQGTLGTALWLIGWYGAGHFGGLYSKFNPNKKRKEGELQSDEMEVNGKMIPKPVQHALPFETIQFAATARHIYDNSVSKGTSSPEALYEAGMGSIGALAEQVPVVETPVHVVEAATNPYEAQKLKQDVSRRLEPQILRETGILDKKGTIFGDSGNGGGGGGASDIFKPLKRPSVPKFSILKR